MAQILKFQDGNKMPSETENVKSVEETKVSTENTKLAEDTKVPTETYPSIVIDGISYDLNDEFKNSVYEYIKSSDETLQPYMKSLFDLYTDGTVIDTMKHTISGIDMDSLNIEDRKKRKLSKRQTELGSIFNSGDMNNWKKATYLLSNYSPKKVEEDATKPEKKQLEFTSISIVGTPTIQQASMLSDLKTKLNDINIYELTDKQRNWLTSDAVTKYNQIIDNIVTGKTLSEDDIKNLKDIGVNYTLPSKTTDSKSNIKAVSGNSNNPTGIISNSPTKGWNGTIYTNSNGESFDFSLDALMKSENSKPFKFDGKDKEEMMEKLKVVNPETIFPDGTKFYVTKSKNGYNWITSNGNVYGYIKSNKKGGTIPKYKNGNAIGQWFEDNDINLKPMLPHALGIIDHLSAVKGNNKIANLKTDIANATLSGIPIKQNIVYPTFSSPNYIINQNTINKFRDKNINLSSDAIINLGHKQAKDTQILDKEIENNNVLSNAYSEYKNQVTTLQNKDNELSAQNENAARQIATNARVGALQSEAERVYNNTTSLQKLVRKWITDLEKDTSKKDALRSKLFMNNASSIILDVMSKKASQLYKDASDPLTTWKTSDPSGYLAEQDRIFSNLLDNMPQTSLFYSQWK